MNDFNQELEFHFDGYSQWDAQLYGACLTFFETFDRYPNIFVSNEVTQASIDEKANSFSGRSHVASADNERPEPDDWIEITQFSGEDFRVTFCVAPDMEDHQFLLIYDEDEDEDTSDIWDPELASVR